MSRRVLAAAALAALVAGCGDTPPPTLYTLAAEPGTVIDRPVAAIAVRSVEIAKYLDRPQIVRHRNAYELATAEFDRWGEGLGDMVTRVLVADLALRLPASQITVQASPVSSDAPLTLAVDIARFDPDPDGTAVLEVRWTVRRGGRAGAVRLERIAVHAASPATIDLAAAMSDCLGQLSDHVAEALAAPPG